jgi:hypothetical protein
MDDGGLEPSIPNDMDNVPLGDTIPCTQVGNQNETENGSLVDAIREPSIPNDMDNVPLGDTIPCIQVGNQNETENGSPVDAIRKPQPDNSVITTSLIREGDIAATHSNRNATHDCGNSMPHEGPQPDSPQEAVASNYMDADGICTGPSTSLGATDDAFPKENPLSPTIDTHGKVDNSTDSSSLSTAAVHGDLDLQIARECTLIDTRDTVSSLTDNVTNSAIYSI